MNDILRLASRKPLIPADTDLLPHADLAFIFGNKYIIPELAAQAAILYKKGQTSKILAAGGVLTDHGQTEAHALYHALKDCGVPDRAIILESESRNTEENITLGKRIIDDTLGLQNVESVIGLGHAVAGPRFTMSLARHWPSVLPMHISVFPESVNAENWQENREFLKRAFSDAAKLPFYAHMNYVAPVLPQDVNRMIGDHYGAEISALALKAS